MSDNDRSPEDCLRQFRAGEPDALGELFDLTAPELFAVALSIAPDAATAEDALQETFLVLLDSADRHNPSRPVLPWLAGILRMKLKESRRRAGRSPDPQRLRPTPPPDDPLDLAGRSELTAKTREAIEHLEEPYRSVALLRWRYGLEPAEIAHVRGDPPGTVRSILHRALTKLRKGLPVLPAFLMMARPARGLDVVREAILAKSVAGAAATTGTIGGVAVVTKLVASIAALGALALLGVWVFSPGNPTPGFTPSREAERPPIHAADLSTEVSAGAPIEVVSRNAASITGRFEHRRTFQPIAGVQVNAGDGSETLSGPDGTFRVDGVSLDDRVTLQATGKGLADFATTLPLLTGGIVTDLGDIWLGPPESMKVRVMTTDRQPIAEAVVEAHRYLVHRNISAHRFPRTGRRPPPHRTAVTNGSGETELTGLAPGTYVLTAAAPGYARPEFVYASIGGETTVTIMLEDGHALTGIVHSSDGLPVPGAEVWAWRRNSRPSDVRPGQIWRETADQEGRFTFVALPGRDVSITVRKPDGVFGVVAQVAPAVRGEVEIRLPAEGVVTGRAFDQATGDPVSGVELMATLRGSGLPPGVSTLTRTGEDGRFRLAGLPLGTEVLFHPVRNPEWVGYHIQTNQPGSKTEVGPVANEVEVPLLRRGGIEGTVTGPRGEPVAGARIVALGAWHDWSAIDVNYPVAEARSDRLGHFRLDGIAPEPVFLVGRTGNLISPHVPGSSEMMKLRKEGSGSPNVVQVKAGTTVRRGLVLANGLAVSGRVLGADGKPVADTSVYTLNRHIAGIPAADTRTDEAGNFRLEGIPRDGALLRIGAMAGNDRASSEPLSPGPDGEVEGVVLRLGRNTASISGLIVTPEGIPAKDAAIYVLPSGNWEPRHGIPAGTRMAVDRDGSFVIDGIHVGPAPWTVRLMATAPGWLPGLAKVPVSAGETVRDLRITLADGAVLAGRVENPDGSPAAGIPVAFFVDPSGSSRPNPLPDPMAVTGAHGEFSIPGAPPSERLCLLVGPERGRVQFVRQVRAGPDPGVVRLDVLVTVGGIVRGPDGEPAANVKVVVMGSGRLRDAGQQTLTGPDGTFEFHNVPQGAFRLVASTGRGRDRHSREYPAGTEHVEVTLSEKADFLGRPASPQETPAEELRVSGRVVDGEAHPVRRAMVWLTRSGKGGSGRTSGDDGSFSFQARRGETYILEAGHAEAGVATLEGVVANTHDLVLVLGSAPRSLVRGMVIGADGRPASGVRVRALRRHRGISNLGPEDMGVASTPDPTVDVETRSGPDGAFELPGLLPDEWVLMAGERGKAPVTANSVVRKSTDATPAELRVGGGWTLRARLLDANGQPVPRVEVTVVAAKLLPFPGRPRQVRVQTKEDGSFVVDALPPQAAKVYYRDDQLENHAFTVEVMGVGDKPAVLRLVP